MNFEEEYGAESISRNEGDNDNECVFRFKDRQGDEKEVKAKLSDPFSSLVDKYEKNLGQKGKFLLLIAVGGKLVKKEGTVREVLEKYFAKQLHDYTPSEINENVVFNVCIRLNEGK